jgi:hypothetical protein
MRFSMGQGFKRRGSTEPPGPECVSVDRRLQQVAGTPWNATLHFNGAGPIVLVDPNAGSGFHDATAHPRAPALRRADSAGPSA